MKYTLILLMEEMLHHLGYIKPFPNNGINYLPTGGFQPSTVSFIFSIQASKGSHMADKMAATKAALNGPVA